MAITSVGYGGTVDYPDYGKGVVTPGRYSFDDSTHFRPTRRTGGADRTVRIAGGTAQGYGIRDTESDDYVDYQLPSVSSGGQWFAIYLKRDWSANGGEGLTSIVHVASNTSGEPIPPSSGVTENPGVVAYQPICYAHVRSGEQYVTEVRDLRVWANDGGLTAVDEGALLFYDRPGTKITIGRRTYTWSLAANGAKSLDFIDGEIEDTGWVTSQFSGESNWSGTRQYRIKAGIAYLRIQGQRTGGNLVNADFQPMTIPSRYLPSAAVYGTCWVGSSANRAYILPSTGVVHVNPMTINQNNTFQVYITWPVG